MTRVFLSYNTADSVMAEEVTAALRARGAEVFRFGDHRGSQFIGQIQQELERADLFIALMSPEAMASDWCRIERETAFHREIELKRQFIYVFMVRKTPKTGSAFLRTKDWIDLTKAPSADSTRSAVAALGLDAAALVSPDEGSPWTVFRNREDELTRIVNALTTTGTEDLWLVVSPPKMGKTWFLQQVLLKFGRLEPTCLHQFVDVGTLSTAYRFDWVKLLCLLLDVEEPASGALGEDERFGIAATISKRARHQLYLLDSAELLEPATATRLRSELTAIYKLVQRSGNHQTRMSVVIGSRRQKEWEGYGAGGGVLFELLSLSEFSVGVVRKAVHEFGRNFGNDMANRWAEGLHNLSEGLPRVLIEGLRWAEDTAFLRIVDCESVAPNVFDRVARAYVKDDLLAFDSLLPLGGDDLEKRKAALEAALRVVAPYRLFTQSHLQHHVEIDAEFADAVNAAGWEVPALWLAMARIALIQLPSDELWLVLNPPIRRLLYRYHYADAPSRYGAHVAAREFYEKWAVGGAGVEQGPVLVECLWHETTKLLHEHGNGLPRRLPDVAVDLTRMFRRPERFGPAEFGDYVTRLLGNDAELAMLLGRFDGLFDEVVAKVGDTISGGG